MKTHPDLLRKNLKLKHNTKKVHKVVNTFLMNVSFKGDTAGEILKDRLSKSLNKISAKLHISFSSQQLVPGFVKDKSQVYKFICFCGASYIDGTRRILPKRISERYLAWLSRGECKSINSSILEHLVNSGHIALHQSPP
ncbi:unnamed protein product [Heterobilharzia americana]|nr:unnamed protein product [Heterobilharzia americana]